ncbi:MAG: DoxX family protein [Flavobacteriales bacterium]|nr:DoxX family protein [Flavobacteriales bacterium]
MKHIVTFCRILIGLLFIYGGLTKLDDPTGFQYKLEEYFTVFSSDVAPTQDSIITDFTIGDKKEIVTTLLTQFDKNFSLTITQDDWKEDAAGRLASEIHVYNDGNLAFSHTLTSLDSQVAAQNLTINSNISGKNILSKKVSLGMPASESQSAEADVQSYIKPKNGLMKLFEKMHKNALYLSIFMSWLEAILGFALLIGWQPKFTVWSLTALILFFTFLTYYSWTYNKVTDCGCFGDALKMTPKESFFKNLITIALIIVLIVWNKHIKPIFSNPFGAKILTILTILLLGFAAYCKHYLPVVDFLHYAEGTDLRKGMEIPEGERSVPHTRTVWLYKAKDGSDKTIHVKYDSDTKVFDPVIDYSKWIFVKVLEENTIEEAYEPPIHDFVFNDADGNDHIEEFWTSKDKLLIVSPDLSKSNEKAFKKLQEIAKAWKKSGKEVWALAAATKEEADAFRHELQLSDIQFYYGDKTNIKSIIRSNPGLLLIGDTSVVVKVWPSTRLPSAEKLLKMAE